MNENFIETVEEVKDVIQTGTSAIHICGDDYSRIDEFIKALKEKLGFDKIDEWNYGYGQVDFENRQIIGGLNQKQSFSEFLANYNDTIRYKKRIILIRNAHHVLDVEKNPQNSENLAQLQQNILKLKKTHSKDSCVLIYCDERRFIPDELASLVYFLDIKPPSEGELSEIAKNLINNSKITKEEKNKIIKELSSNCVGMSADAFKQVLKKANLKGDIEKEDFKKEVFSLAMETKKQFIDKSGLLRSVKVDVDLEKVGGLLNLKRWLWRKEKAFNNPNLAKENGVTPAKGILLVGMPGCGKSLTSKAIAKFFGIPLLSLDIGSIMGKYMGESEENLRRALRLAENCSPCVLWIDEIEKAFAGVGGDESGVSQRILGYLLTWMNDKTARVFVVATANDVMVLPPEFLRRGRFDEIFYVDFPTAKEREDIFKIKLGEAYEEEGGLDFIETFLQEKGNKEKFEELTRDRKESEKKDAKESLLKLLSDIENQIKERLDKALKDKNYDEVMLLRHKKKEYTEILKKEIEESDVEESEIESYKGTEGYAGSDIEALVNNAIEEVWKRELKEPEKYILDILQQQRKYVTPLKEVLADKIKKSREKFGQYKLTSAADMNIDIDDFVAASKSSDKYERLACAKNLECPLEQLRMLSKDDDRDVKLAVIENKNSDRSCGLNLKRDKDQEVRKKAENRWPKGEVVLPKLRFDENGNCLNLRFRSPENAERGDR